MNDMEKAKKWIEEADALLIGARNGLSIAEGYNLFACNDMFQRQFGDFQRRFGIMNVIQGCFFDYPDAADRKEFFKRLVHYWIEEYRPSDVMKNLRRVVGNKPYFILTSNGDTHLELSGFEADRVFEIEKRPFHPRSGHYRTVGKGHTAYEAFVPVPLQDVRLAADNGLMRLANEAMKHLQEADHEGLDCLESEVESSVKLAWNIPPLYLSVDDNDISHKAAIDCDNLRQALRYGIAHLDSLPLSGRLLKDIHWIARGCYQGEMRSSPVWMGSDDDTLLSAPFVPPSPDDMLNSFYALEQFINAPSELHPLIKAALIHYQFEAIHPFIDGNGRVGRILTLLYLIDQGAISKVSVNLSGILHLRQFQYYTGFASVEISGTYEKWVRFFLEAVAMA